MSGFTKSNKIVYIHEMFDIRSIQTKWLYFIHGNFYDLKVLCYRIWKLFANIKMYT